MSNCQLALPCLTCIFIGVTMFKYLLKSLKQVNILAFLYLNKILQFHQCVSVCMKS